MPDLAWLPSSVMQTVGALYTIFVAVFIIQIQFLSREKNEKGSYLSKRLINLKITFYEKMFLELAYFTVIVEAVCGMLIYCFSDHDSILKSAALLFVYVLFICFIAYIVVFSKRLVSELTGSEPLGSEYYNNHPISRIQTQKFVRYNVYILLFFIAFAFYVLVLVYSHSSLIAIGFGIGLFLLELYMYFIIFEKSIKIFKNKKRK